MDMLYFLQSRGIGAVVAGDGRRDKHVSVGWAQMRCPLCGGDKLWLGYHLRDDYFNCYNHGFASKWSLFRAWFPKENAEELLRLIDDAPLLPQKEAVKSGEYRPPMPQKPLGTLRFHRNYVRSRGLNPDELSEKWRVTALDWNAEWAYRNRLFFPVCDRAGKPVSWLTRTIAPDETYRYLTAPKDREAVPIKSLLYGEQFVSPFETVIVCEGVFDALRIGRNAVATLGKKITPAQFDKIARFQRRILCFDAENDTQEQAKALANRLQAFPGLTDNVCLDAPDPAEASQKEIETLLKFAELL